jgi:hypothetical protein
MEVIWLIYTESPLGKFSGTDEITGARCVLHRQFRSQNAFCTIFFFFFFFFFFFNTFR